MAVAARGGGFRMRYGTCAQNACLPNTEIAVELGQRAAASYFWCHKIGKLLIVRKAGASALVLF